MYVGGDTVPGTIDPVFAVWAGRLAVFYGFLFGSCGAVFVIWCWPDWCFRGWV